MTRSPRLAFAILLAGCGSLGNSGEFSSQVSNGGTGPFRLATADETGLTTAPIGTLFRSTTDAIGRSYAETNVVVYDVARRLDTPPTRDPSLPNHVVDRAQYEPRRIARSTTHVTGTDGNARLGFEFGTDILVPTLPWETGGVYDPAIATMADGTVRLYYATDAGIGVASADAIDGIFTRLATSPLLADVDGRGPARSPTVAVLPSGEIAMYFALGGAIHVARSTDGLAFELVDADPATAAIDPIDLSPPPTDVDAGMPDPDAGTPVTETGLGAPTVVVTRSQTGRALVRLYFEAHASDGTVTLRIAGSYDGYAFERSAIVCYKKNNPTSPSVYLPEDGITRLSFVLPRGSLATLGSSAVLASAPPERMLPLP